MLQRGKQFYQALYITRMSYPVTRDSKSPSPVRCRPLFVLQPRLKGHFEDQWTAYMPPEMLQPGQTASLYVSAVKTVSNGVVYDADFIQGGEGDQADLLMRYVQHKGSPGQDADRSDHLDADFNLHLLCCDQKLGGAQRPDKADHPRQILAHIVCWLRRLVVLRLLKWE